MVIIGPANQVKSIVDAVRPTDNDDDNPKFTKFMPQPVDESGEIGRAHV